MGGINMAQKILDEYTQLINKRLEYMKRLQELPNGYISQKKIGDKKYNYLQFRNNGKIKSIYIKSDKLEETVKLLNLRKEAKLSLPKIEKRINDIENTVKVLDTALFRRLIFLKVSIGMDDICLDYKKECISFSDAMTSIEGVSVSKRVQNELNDWKNGEVSFISIFENTLKYYGFPSEV